MGKKVEEHRGALLLSHPLQHGRVGGSSGGASSTAVTAHTTAWAEMEALWSHVFDPENLKTASTEQAVGTAAADCCLLLLPRCLLVLVLTLRTVTVTFTRRCC